MRNSFNGLTGTPLARLRKKDRWAAQAEAMLAGESLAKAAKRCGVKSLKAEVRTGTLQEMEREWQDYIKALRDELRK